MSASTWRKAAAHRLVEMPRPDPTLAWTSGGVAMAVRGDTPRKRQTSSATPCWSAKKRSDLTNRTLVRREEGADPLDLRGVDAPADMGEPLVLIVRVVPKRLRLAPEALDEGADLRLGVVLAPGLAVEMAPVRPGAEHRIAEEDNDPRIRVIGVDAFDGAAPVDVGRRDLTGDRAVEVEIPVEAFEAVPRYVGFKAAVVVEIVELLAAGRQFDLRVEAEEAIKGGGAALLDADTEEPELPLAPTRAGAEPATTDQVRETIIERHPPCVRAGAATKKGQLALPLS